MQVLPLDRYSDRSLALGGDMHFIDRKYSDAPVLSDSLLLPAIDSGEKLNSVSGFIPSYIATLFHDLAESPDVEPGEISILLSIENKGGLIDSLRSVYDSRTVDFFEFLGDARQLVGEGGLNFRVQLVPAKSQVTNSAVFILEETNGDIGFAFTDELRGDLNSPIQLFPKHGSKPEFEAFQAASELLSTAELLLFGGEGVFILNSDGFSSMNGQDDAPFEEMQSPPSRDLSYYEDVRASLKTTAPARRVVEHAPPVEEELLSKLSSKIGLCWCGNEYEKKTGCKK